MPRFSCYLFRRTTFLAHIVITDPFKMSNLQFQLGVFPHTFFESVCPSLFVDCKYSVDPRQCSLRTMQRLCLRRGVWPNPRMPGQNLLFVPRWESEPLRYRAMGTASRWHPLSIQTPKTVKIGQQFWSAITYCQKAKKVIFVKIFLNPKFNFSFDFNQKCIQSVDQWEDDCRSAWAGKPGQHVLYERRFASVNPHADFARLFLAWKAPKMSTGGDRFVHRLWDEVNLSGRTAVNRSLPVARHFILLLERNSSRPNRPIRWRPIDCSCSSGYVD